MKNYKNLLISIIVILFLVTSCSTLKEELGLGDKAGLTYNSQTLSEKDIDADLKALKDNKPLVKQFSSSQTPFVVKGKLSPDFRVAWLNIQLQILTIKDARIAAKQKITKTDKKNAEEKAKSLFEAQDSETTKKVWEAFPKSFQERLINAFAEEEAFSRSYSDFSDKEIKDFYNKQLCESKVDLSHILVATKAEADNIVKDLNNGGDFAAIAKEKSTDTSSGAQGGELGCLVDGQFVPEFEAAAKKLKEGEISPPTETQYGFHIIKAKKYEAPKLADVKDQIVDSLKNEAQTKAYDGLEKKMKKAKVKVSKKYGKVEKQDGIPSIVVKDSEKKSTPVDSSGQDVTTTTAAS